MLEVNSQVLGKGKAFSVDWGLKACNNSGRIWMKKSASGAMPFPAHQAAASTRISGEAASQRRRHAVGDAAGLAVAAGDQRGAGKFVLAAAPVEDELIQGGLAHRHGRGQFPGGAFVRAPDLTMCEFTTCGTHLRI